jgi:protein-S-isoprenylcysteine O-methyltransferase Ste14
MGKDYKDNANIIAPPPFILIVLLAFGLAIHWVSPVGIMHLPLPLRLLIGLLPIIVSAIISVLSLQIMFKKKTAINPYKQTTSIIDEGPFSFTRNPLYVSIILFHFGFSVLVNSVWILLFLPVLLIILDRGVVLQEEKYLERKFGDEYLQYKRRVRRWI